MRSRAGQSWYIGYKVHIITLMHCWRSPTKLICENLTSPVPRIWRGGDNWERLPSVPDVRRHHRGGLWGGSCQGFFFFVADWTCLSWLCSGGSSSGRAWQPWNPDGEHKEVWGGELGGLHRPGRPGDRGRGGGRQRREEDHCRLRLQAARQQRLRQPAISKVTLIIKFVFEFAL